jgi:para-nitrobenzyl esterase
MHAAIRYLFATSIALASLPGCRIRTTATPPQGDPTVLPTPAGPVRGIAAGTTHVFLGIPYAQAPVGPLRYRPPQPRHRFDAPYDASHYGPACPQLAGKNLGGGPAAADAAVEGNEDCLHLNVWMPSGHKPMPVIVFIHGGAFQQGSNSKAFYDARELAEQTGVVVVTINYRLGALGMIAHESLAAESSDGSAGNYGLRDQIAALQWVKSNISAFGGDPANITLFGESAGAVSVCAMVASPLARGLFARAIIESGGGCMEWPALRAPSAGHAPGGFARGAELAAAAGCGGAADVPACLRSKPAADLVRAGTHLPSVGPLSVLYSPVIDGVVLTGTVFDRLRKGEVDLPLIVGSNADEATIFMGRTSGLDEAGYAALVRSMFGEHAPDVQAIYPVDPEGGVQAAIKRLVTEAVFVCPAIALAQAASGGPHPSYSYHFTRHRRGFIANKLGAFHGIELAYLFWGLPFHPDEEDQQVTRIMRSAWTGFARTGVPDPAWPAFKHDTPSIYRIDVHPTVVGDVTDGRCAALRKAGVIPAP